MGLVAELEKPDVELRKNILRNKIRRDGLNIPESVINYIAENVNESVRELEGIINSLLAQSIIFKRDVDIDLAERIVRKAVRCESKPITIEDIIAKVCSHYEIEESAIHTKTSQKRSRAGTSGCHVPCKKAYRRLLFQDWSINWK